MSDPLDPNAPARPHYALSLRAQLVALVCGVALPLLGLAGYALWQGYDGERQRAAALLLDQTRGIAQQIDAQVARAELLLHMQAGGGADAGKRRAPVAPREVGDLLVINALPVATSPAAHEALRNHSRPTLTNFVAGATTGVGEVHVYYAIGTSPAEPALLRVRMSNQVFQQILVDARLQGRRAAAIVDRDAILVARSRRPELLVGKPATAPVRAGLAQADEGILYNVVNQDGLASVIAFARAPRSGYAAVTAVPEEEFYVNLRAAMTRIVVLGTLVLVLALLACWFGVRHLERALQRVALASRGTAQPTGLRETDELARRLAEAARGQTAALQAKDRFLAVLSHELRTPLSAIVGWVRVLNHGVDAATRERGLQAIDRNARAQARLIDDLLDLSRIAAGKLDLVRAPVALPEIAINVIESAQPHADSATVTLQFEHDGTPCMAMGDAARLQQVLWNLVGNAIKFSRAGGRVRVTVGERDGWVVVCVADDGAGISAALLPHVFEAFRQGDASLTRQHGGLGLGLAIARDIVTQHGGRIEAHSDGAGAGARFTVRLPAVETDAGAAAGGSQRLDGCVVVAVDDDPDNLHLLSTVLAQAGATVRPAASAKAAIELLRSERVDLLVSDIAMPQTDGLALMQAVRGLDTGSARVPAIAVSALTGADDIERTLAAGFAAHLPKPLQPDALLGACARLWTAGTAQRPASLPA